MCVCSVVRLCVYSLLMIRSDLVKIKELTITTYVLVLVNGNTYLCHWFEIGLDE